MPYIGERINDDTSPRAYAHPASGAWWADGRPMDSGTAQLLDSEISHYCDEGSIRPLVSEPGCGIIKTQNQNGYSGLRDAAPVSVSGWGATSVYNISWDRRTSALYGPFSAIDDRALAAIAGNTVRNIVWQLDINSGASNSLALYVAITGTTSAPTGADPFLAHLCASGRSTVQMIVPITQPWGARRAQRSRVNGLAGTTQASMLPMYLRLGWFSTNAADAIYGVTAYETH